MNVFTLVERGIYICTQFFFRKYSFIHGKANVFGEQLRANDIYPEIKR